MRGAALALLVACGGTPSAFAVRFAAGERAETAGRHAEAAEAFDAAASSPAPKREREHAAFLGALEHLRAGDVATGTTRLELVAHSRGEHAAQAQWELIGLALATNAPSASAELDDFLRTYPNDGLAYPALVARLRIARSRGGEAEVLTTLEALEPTVARTDSAGRVAFETAEALAKVGRLDDARAMFVSVATRWPYPHGEYFDDALYRASEVDETLGRMQDAIDDLTRMLAVSESSIWPGSYVRPRFPEAGFRIATLYRDKVGDKKRALAAFERYVERFPNALRRDEALWEAAKLEDGDERACATLARLVAMTPDSRYVPCVVAKCSEVTRPKGSHAPERCHPYLVR